MSEGSTWETRAGGPGLTQAVAVMSALWGLTCHHDYLGSEVLCLLVSDQRVEPPSGPDRLSRKDPGEEGDEESTQSPGGNYGENGVTSQTEGSPWVWCDPVSLWPKLLWGLFLPPLTVSPRERTG